jgi:tetrahedral aminopeptidase
LALFDLKIHLKNLSEAHAISGYETRIHDVLRTEWDALVDEYDRDGLNSLIGIKHATLPNPHKRKMMIAAHLDEIGMFVRDIVDGFILVSNANGYDNRLQLAKTVLVHGKRSLKGVVAATPPHLLPEAERASYPRFDQLVIDVGLSHEEVSQVVRIGDTITADYPMVELMGGLVAGKAFDDRSCVSAMTVCVNLLKPMQHAWDVYFVATVQEENGLYGALTSAQHIAPDLAIALDVTFAPQSGVPQDSTAEIGGGAVISQGINFHPKLYEMLVECAKKNEIKHQTDALPGPSGTDAWAIQTALEGIPTSLLSLPIRNMHSHNETLDLKDIDRMGRLLASFITTLNDETLDKLVL